MARDGPPAQTPRRQWRDRGRIAVTSRGEPASRVLSDRVRAGLAARSMRQVHPRTSRRRAVGEAAAARRRGHRQFNTPAARGAAPACARPPPPARPRRRRPSTASPGRWAGLALGAHVRIAQEGTEIGLTETTLASSPEAAAQRRPARGPAPPSTSSGRHLARRQAAEAGSSAPSSGDVRQPGSGRPRCGRPRGGTRRAGPDQPVPDASAVDRGGPHRPAATAAMRAPGWRRSTRSRPRPFATGGGLDHERALHGAGRGAEVEALRTPLLHGAHRARIDALPRDTQPADDRTAAVIGSSTMMRIAMALADRIPTTSSTRRTRRSPAPAAGSEHLRIAGAGRIAGPGGRRIALHHSRRARGRRGRGHHHRGRLRGPGRQAHRVRPAGRRREGGRSSRRTPRAWTSTSSRTRPPAAGRHRTALLQPANIMRLLEVVREADRGRRAGDRDGWPAGSTSSRCCRRWGRASSATGCSRPTAARRSSCWRAVRAAARSMGPRGLRLRDGPFAMSDLAGST